MLKLKLSVLGAISLCGLSYAATPTPPSLKPPVTYESSVVSASDAAIFRDALQEAKSKNWSALRTYQQNARSEAISDFVLWRLVTGAEAEAGFDTLSLALTRLADWPRMSRIRGYAERALDDSSLSAAQRVDWFKANGGAVTGEGKAVYAAALSNTGQHEQAIEVIRQAWRASTMSSQTEQAVLTRYGSYLNQNDHEARANFLLWGGRGYIGAANRVRAKVSPGYRALMDARIALISRRGSRIDAKISAAPASLKNDPGLLYDRAKWRRRRAEQRRFWFKSTGWMYRLMGATIFGTNAILRFGLRLSQAITKQLTNSLRRMV